MRASFCARMQSSAIVYEISDELSDSAVESKLHQPFGLNVYSPQRCIKSNNQKYFSQFAHNYRIFPVQRWNTKNKSIVFIARNMDFIEFPFGDSIYVHFLLFGAFLVGFLDPPFPICWPFRMFTKFACIEMCQTRKSQHLPVWVELYYIWVQHIERCKKVYWWIESFNK